MQTRKKARSSKKDKNNDKNKNKKQNDCIVMADDDGNALTLQLDDIKKMVTLQFKLDPEAPQDFQKDKDPFIIVKYKNGAVGKIPFHNIPSIWLLKPNFVHMICNHEDNFGMEINGDPQNLSKYNFSFVHGHMGHYLYANYQIKVFIQSHPLQIRLVHVGEYSAQTKYTKGDNAEDYLNGLNQAALKNATFNKDLPFNLVSYKLYFIRICAYIPI